MFSHNKRLQYTVRVNECKPRAGQSHAEQFGGPQANWQRRAATSLNTLRRMIPAEGTC